MTPLAKALEDLLIEYKVDLVHTAHHHDYSRTWPVYKSVPEKEDSGHREDIFVRPKSPVYVVQGTGGALRNDHPLDEKPVWSIKRLTKYGFGRVTIKENVLKYEFVEAPSGRVID